MKDSGIYFNGPHSINKGHRQQILAMFPAGAKARIKNHISDDFISERVSGGKRSYSDLYKGIEKSQLNQ